jgi:endonuclease/exonuclease/phosphatase family metal-dependent hydrolase
MPDVPLIGPVAPPDLSVMTFNIRRRIPHLSRRSPDHWNRRKGAVAATLRLEKPTVVAVQEALADQREFVGQALGPHYRSLGYGRNADRRGEIVAIFFDTRRLNLLEWEQLALSDTPEVQGSRTWGNMVPRVVVSARFADLANGTEFLVLATHFDHLSRVARLKSARMLRRLALDAACPVVVMGDVNTDEGTKPYLELTADGGLRDTWTVAETKLTAEWGTFPNYRRPRPGTKRIDWILVSAGFEVRSAGVNTARHHGHAASDHHPVQAVIRNEPDQWPGSLGASETEATATATG